jgi:hypothetical protein
MSLANTARKQAGGFQKGQSGNPRGRPAGSRNNATLACEALLEGQAEALTQKAVELALAGDTIALRLCMERLCPVRKDRPVSFPLPPINTARDAANVAAAVTEAVAVGQITPSEAGEIGRLVEAYVKAYHAAELDDRAMPVHSLTDEELTRIIRSGESTPPRLLTIDSS